MFGTECFFNLFLGVSQIQYVKMIEVQIGNDNWDSETYRKSLEKATDCSENMDRLLGPVTQTLSLTKTELAFLHKTS